MKNDPWEQPPHLLPSDTVRIMVTMIKKLKTMSRREILAFLAALIVLIIWLVYTPSGLMGKEDAVGYAVCHRIAERSYFLGTRQMPLCSRCTGMYLGAFAGLIYMARKGRRAGFPPKPVLIVLGIFALFFIVDGVNSFMGVFPALPQLYTPMNGLRLVTGTMLGILIPAVLVPVFHQTAWTEVDATPILNSWLDLLKLLAIALALDIAVLSGIPLLLYPIAFISATTVLAVLTITYSVIWTMVQRKDNKYRILREYRFNLLLGFITAVAQIALLDLIRYSMTGTWEGFIL